MKPASRTVATRSFRVDPRLLAAARRATKAKDDTEAVRLALLETVERARLCAWMDKVAGRGKFDGYDA